MYVFVALIFAGCAPNDPIHPPPSLSVAERGPTPPPPGTIHHLAWSADALEAAAIDVDFDGLLDVVTVDPDRVRLWQNQGGNTFVPALDSELDGATTVAVVDLDVDGDDDVVAGAGVRLMVYDNVGGALALPVQIASGGAFTYSLSAADVDGDGLPDVAYASSTEVFWHRNLGGGVLGPAVFVTYGHGDPLMFSDLDADGDPDIVIADHGAVMVCKNDGAGFGRCPKIARGGFTSADGFAPLDVDFDGDLDIVTTRFDGVHWSENLGGVGFANERLLSPVEGLTDIAAADMDGDGIDDLAFAAVRSHAGWLPHLAGGGFGPPVELYSSQGDHALLTGDFDADGDVDLFAMPAGLALVENLGQGTFAHPTVVALATLGGVRCHDVDGDGANDIALSEPYRDRVSWVNMAGDTFHVVGLRQTSPAALAVADVDGDGRDDLVAESSLPYPDLGVGWYPNLGGTFDPVVGVTLARTQGVTPFDSDQDGDVDFVAAEPAKIVAMENPGSGASFQKRVLVYDDELLPSANDDVAFGIPFAADLGNDGYDDLLVPVGVCTLPSCFDDHLLGLAWFPNSGAGAVGPPTQVSTGLSLDRAAVTDSAGRAVDLDADGDIDVLLLLPGYVSSGSSQVMWMENDGLGNLAAPVALVSDIPQPPRAEVSDVDLDGDEDVVVATDAGGLAWFAYDNGAFDRVDLPAFGGRPVGAMSRCDADADGDEDIVLGGDGLGWWENPHLP